MHAHALQCRSAARYLVLLIVVLAFADCTAAEEPTTASPLVVPDGTPTELIEYIKSLPPTSTEGRSRQEWIAGVLQKMRASGLAADRILAHEDLDEESTLFALRVKMTALQTLGHAEKDEEVLREAIRLAETYLDDPRGRVADEARNHRLMTRAALAKSLPPEQQQELLEQLLETVRVDDLKTEDLSWPIQFGGTLAVLGPPELAARFYEELARAAARSTDDYVRSRSEMFDGAVRRMRLVGSPIEIEGETLTGETLDWESYRGKVVLVEFWATWCVPCMPELADLLEHYERYHDRGFEVIGVSLDGRRADVEQFVADRGIPWVTLFGSEPAERGRNHPIAVRYGINGIPAGILIGRDGKVISVNAKGEELDRLLQTCLAPRQRRSAEIPANDSQPSETLILRTSDAPENAATSVHGESGRRGRQRGEREVPSSPPSASRIAYQGTPPSRSP